MVIRLIRPTEAYAQQIIDYRQAVLDADEPFDGCAGLEETQSYAEWADFENRQRRKYGAGYVPSEVFLAIRASDNRLVGMINYRHPLSAFLLQFGGNIGYSVAPAERRKGYATEMLWQMLDVCRDFGESRVLVCCDKDNEASRRTILRCGGVLENEVADTVGICAEKGGLIQRYWITL